MSRWITQRRTLSILISVWAALVACGMLYLADYATEPADGGSVDNEWPAETFSFQDGGPNVLLFLHPRCPCSRASVKQFQQLVAARPENVHVAAVIRSAQEFEGLTLGTDLSWAVRQIPGIRIIQDLNGEIAKQFGVATSGHVLLFGAGGRLLFSGGVTESRGHEGDNQGSRLFARTLADCCTKCVDDNTNTEIRASINFVYGCALDAREELSTRKATR